RELRWEQAETTLWISTQNPTTRSVPPQEDSQSMDSQACLRYEASHSATRQRRDRYYDFYVRDFHHIDCLRADSIGGAFHRNRWCHRSRQKKPRTRISGGFFRLISRRDVVCLVYGNSSRRNLGAG